MHGVDLVLIAGGGVSDTVNAVSAGGVALIVFADGVPDFAMTLATLAGFQSAVEFLGAEGFDEGEAESGYGVQMVGGSDVFDDVFGSSG